MQAAVGSRSPQAAVVMGRGGYFHTNLGVLQAVRVCTEALPRDGAALLQLKRSRGGTTWCSAQNTKECHVFPPIRE
jgi:hypothetical protein